MSGAFFIVPHGTSLTLHHSKNILVPHGTSPTLHHSKNILVPHGTLPTLIILKIFLFHMEHSYCLD